MIAANFEEKDIRILRRTEYKTPIIAIVKIETMAIVCLSEGGGYSYGESGEGGGEGTEDEELD